MFKKRTKCETFSPLKLFYGLPPGPPCSPGPLCPPPLTDVLAVAELKFDDPDVNIIWPMGDLKPEDLLTSEKDAKWPSLQELKNTDLFSNL